MVTQDKIENKIAQSGLITLDLEEYYPEGEMVLFDIKDYLFEGLMLKEKPFREEMEKHDWTQYKGKHVGIYCSTDAIIPIWAFMLITVYLEPFAKTIVQGGENELNTMLFQKTLAEIDLEKFRDERVIIKGCSDKMVPLSAYTELTRLLKPIAKSIMFGEPCSTVPLFKKRKV